MSPSLPILKALQMTLVTAIVLTLLSGCAMETNTTENSDGDSITMLMNAEFAPHTGSRSPPEAGWNTLSMREPLFSQQPDHSSAAWVQFKIPATTLIADQTDLVGLYFWRFNSNIAVWFNGVYLGDGGKMGDKPSRNWNRPMLFSVPSSSIVSGENLLQVELAAWPGEAWLGPPLTGPNQQLKTRYQQRMWLQVRTAEMASAFSLIVGLMALAFWLRQRSEKQYFWFAAGSFAITFWSAYYFLPQVPYDGLWFRKAGHLGMDVWSLCMVQFFYTSLGRSSNLRGAGLAMVFGALSILYFAAESAETRNASLISHGITLIISSAVTGHMALIFLRERISDALVFAIAMLPVLGFALHDLVHLSSTTLEAWTDNVFMVQYAGVISTSWITWHLTRRYAHALIASQQQQSVLEQRVEEARAEQAKAFARSAHLETEAAVTGERERIFRDLHDDVGAKLLSLVFSAKDPRSSDLARSALEDLRDTVSRVADGSLPLIAAVDDWKDECTKRLALSETELIWDDRSIHTELEVSQAYRTAMGRVLREAISNALRHASPSYIGVHFEQVGHDAEAENRAILKVTVRNNGNVGDVEAWEAGRGLANIQLRCRQLGGSARWFAAKNEAVLEYQSDLTFVAA